jgi:hypothetical protein
MESLVGQLQTLDHHSALYLLHTLTPLARLPENRVLALLQQLLPRQPGRGQPARSRSRPVRPPARPLTY